MGWKRPPESDICPAHVGHTRPGSPVLIRYADDLVALCHSREEAEQVKRRLAEWLAPRGLTFNEGKTRIVHLTEGFDFLGFHVRRFANGKLIIKPSKAAARRIRERLRTEMRALRGANAAAVLQRLNPIIRGWAAYYRTVVSKHAFTTLDAYVWWLAFKWGRPQPPEQAEALGSSPLLRRVQRCPARQLGVRRPGDRRLPHEVRLDQDRPTPDGRWLRVT